MPLKKNKTTLHIVYVVKVQILHTSFLTLGGKENRAGKGIEDGLNSSSFFFFNQTNTAKLHLLNLSGEYMGATLFSILCISKITE